MSELGFDVSNFRKSSDGRVVFGAHQQAVKAVVDANRQRGARTELATAAAVILAGFVGFTDAGNKAVRSSFDVLGAARDAITSATSLREAPAKPAAKGIVQAFRHDR